MENEELYLDLEKQSAEEIKDLFNKNIKVKYKLCKVFLTSPLSMKILKKHEMNFIIVLNYFIDFFPVCGYYHINYPTEDNVSSIFNCAIRIFLKILRTQTYAFELLIYNKELNKEMILKTEDILFSYIEKEGDETDNKILNQLIFLFNL